MFKRKLSAGADSFGCVNKVMANMQVHGASEVAHLRRQHKKQIFEKVYLYFIYIFFTEVGDEDNKSVSQHQHV